MPPAFPLPVQRKAPTGCQSTGPISNQGQTSLQRRPRKAVFSTGKGQILDEAVLNIQPIWPCNTAEHKNGFAAGGSRRLSKP